MDALYRSMAVLIDAPWLAAAPGLVLLWLWARSGRRLVGAAALAWLLYLPYELGMKWRLLCSGECNIRIDLLGIYPALAVLSALAIVSAALGGRRSDG
jgi:hypothetical protein